MIKRGRSSGYAAWNCQETTFIFLFNELSLLLLLILLQLLLLLLILKLIGAERRGNFALLFIARNDFIVIELREDVLA